MYFCSFFITGLGLENCVLVKTDDRGRMSMPDLRKEIQRTLSEGKVPFAVGATAGLALFKKEDASKKSRIRQKDCMR
jgi:glutamate/tyrosine decarboxylase-like PLP-dependent enzyme